jgi:two-component system chemotaxis response regulator CheY
MRTDISGLLIFLVEPSALQAKVVCTMLARRGGLNVRRFDEAGAALAAAAAEPPGLLISALYLPDMAGTELVQRMRNESKLAHTPFILISSETRPQILDPVRQSGVCGILPKPFNDAQLDTALRATMDYLDQDSALDVEEVDLTSIRVLLVDDSPSARRFMRRTMENLGIRHFVEAENGVEAVSIMADTAFDLVVTDYNMPEMDGKGLLDYIRTQSWQSSVPVLMVTSESNEGRLAAVEEAGVSGICDKPFEPRTVRALLTRILRTGE